jgi:2-polyprenyl-6-methoxyphenol hydroxylase-like FAD-dependent oxidoreductase
MGREIQIIGGGLAGLTLGLALRREGIPVAIWEAGTYPRHRVCGEFISGRGISLLQTLQLPDLPALGTFAHTMRFYDGENKSSVLDLPEPALSIDRSRLDHLLATEFQRLGGILHENQRWNGPFSSEGLVRATGRRLHKDKTAALIGLKAHASGVFLDADLELHFSNRGYVGLSRLPSGEVNVCGLFRTDSQVRLDRSSKKFGRMFTHGMGDTLAERLATAQFQEETFSAVAGLSLDREGSSPVGECRLGDSICMIPPLTGNGMSIAIETALLAAPLLRDYCLRESSWARTVSAVSQDCSSLLRKRLSAAAILQNLCSGGNGRKTLLFAVNKFPGALRFCFALTR